MEDAEWNNARYFLYSFTIVNEGQKSEETDSLLYYGIVSIKQITSETLQAPDVSGAQSGTLVTIPLEAGAPHILTCFA